MFCAQVGLALPRLGDDLRQSLEDRLTHARTPKEFQFVRDTLAELQRLDRAWMDGVRAALLQRQKPAGAPQRFQHTVPGRLELQATEVVEDELLASRLAESIAEANQQAWRDLKLRLQFTQDMRDLSPHDVTRPMALAKLLVEEWIHAGLSRESWQKLAPTLHASAGQHLAGAYAEANRLLVSRGVLADIDLKHVVRKAASSAAAAPAGARASGPDDSGHAPAAGGEGGPPSGVGLQWWSRVRTQTQDMVGRLARLLGERSTPPGPADSPATAGDGTAHHPPPMHPSPALEAMLMAEQRQPLRMAASSGGSGQAFESTAGLQQVQWAAQQLHQQTRNLKQAAESPSEKAIIEIVALMFQSILSEDRIQPSLRVWFARLQIPVLRVALAEPDFFNSMQHPARRLIDRMGACVMGFDSQVAEVSAQELEAEIRRTVQVIEQYPESGRRVFQLALDEFQKFLARHLQSQGQTGRVVSLAQQVEQKETLAVQYTIEMRKQLNDMPVHDSIRHFLFKVWAEVLAIATVKFGPQHETMLALKQAASDLVWAASGKPTRAERSQVIAQLPGLLTRLRKGMTLMGMDNATQDEEVKAISAILADAFMSKTETIPADQLAAVTRNLSNLEDFLPLSDDSDLELDQDSIELITGIDASNIEVITHGGAAPAHAVRAWANELQLGTWLRMDHNHQVSQVQLAWRSERGQLCLFVTARQRYYLMQSARVASYLQAGLLVPVEDESLTVRATRSALEKLDANPERLLT